MKPEHARYFSQKTLLYIYASNKKYVVNGKISHFSFSLYLETSISKSDFDAEVG